eukprot:299219-Chlamydomonas_euryale.AAC.1
MAAAGGRPLPTPLSGDFERRRGVNAAIGTAVMQELLADGPAGGGNPGIGVGGSQGGGGPRFCAVLPDGSMPAPPGLRYSYPATTAPTAPVPDEVHGDAASRLLQGGAATEGSPPRGGGSGGGTLVAAGAPPLPGCPGTPGSTRHMLDSILSKVRAERAV